MVYIWLVRRIFYPFNVPTPISLLRPSIPMSWRKPFSDRAGEPGTVIEAQIDHGRAHYIGERGGNDAPPTYQDASGAPVENKSPLGYAVGPATITLLNITMMIGAGIYSTRE